ncbi:hypothetical protein JCM11491_006483 [Sporobolomyces phaffii]
MSNSSRTGTPQPWGAATGSGSGGGGLQLPQPPKGKGGAGQRSTSQEPNGDTTGGGGGKATNVNSLMDAVGASGVDLGAEEESLRASNERAHAQAMMAAAAATSSSGSTSSHAAQQHAYTGVDRSRKQDFIDPSVLAECVKKVAAAFQLKTLEPDTIPLIALATRHRVQQLVDAAKSARDHRHASSHFKPPPLVPASKRRRRRQQRGAPRRDPLTGDLVMDDDNDMEGGSSDNDEDEDEDEDDEDEDEAERAKRPKVAAWDTVVYDDAERYLAVLERVDRTEETKARRERMQRDDEDQRARDHAEEVYAAELAKRALDDDEREHKLQLQQQGGGASGGGGGGDATPGGADKGKGPKAKNAADRFLASNHAGDVPSTPTKDVLGKNGKPKKKKKSKAGPGPGPNDTPGGDGPTSTPGGGGPSGASGTSTPSATSIAKNMSDDVRKRLTDSSAMKSLGGAKYSWMNAGGAGGGIGSPSPATAGGVSSLLGKPKFAPATSFGTPSGSGSSSLLNPANHASSLELVNALTTSRLNVPQLHDSQRTQIAKDEWEAGHHVVEMGDLLFAMDRERGTGVGKGSGRNVALRGRAGITRGGYRGGGGVGR